jgi:hypothetical protein
MPILLPVCLTVRWRVVRDDLQVPPALAMRHRPRLRTASCCPTSSAMEMRSGASETRSPPSSYFLTASFNALAAVNLGAFVAGILIGLPVLGLTP